MSIPSQIMGSTMHTTADGKSFHHSKESQTSPWLLVRQTSYGSFSSTASRIAKCAGTKTSQMHEAQRTVETRLLMSGLWPFENFARAGTLLDVPAITLPTQSANLQGKDVVPWSGMSKGHVKVILIAFCSDKYFHNS